MPEDLDQVAAFATEHLAVASVQIEGDRLLHLQRQAVHAAAHVVVPCRQLYPHAMLVRDHPRSTESTRRNAAGLTASSTHKRTPSANSLSINSSALRMLTDVLPHDSTGNTRRSPSVAHQRSFRQCRLIMNFIPRPAWDPRRKVTASQRRGSEQNDMDAWAYVARNPRIGRTRDQLADRDWLAAEDPEPAFPFSPHGILAIGYQSDTAIVWSTAAIRLPKLNRIDYSTWGFAIGRSREGLWPLTPRGLGRVAFCCPRAFQPQLSLVSPGRRINERS